MKHKKPLRSFQKKISTAFVLLAAVFVLLTAVLVAVTLTQVYRAQTGERLSFEAQQLGDTLNRAVANINGCANSVIIQLNSDWRVSLRQAAESEQPDRDTTQFIFSVLLNSLRRTPDVSSINILLQNGTLCQVEYNRSPTLLTAAPSLRRALTELGVTPRGAFYSLPEAGGGEGTLYYAKQLRDTSTNTPIGVVYLEIRAETLAGYCVSTQDSSIVLTDGDTVLACTGSLKTDGTFALPSGGSGSLAYGGGRWLFQTRAVARTGWQVTCLLDEAKALAPIRTAVAALVGAAAAMLLMMSLVTMVIARRLCRPVRELSDHMVSSAGEMPLPIAVPQQTDEIAVLYDSFNSMLQQNRQLFADYKAEQKQKTRTEFAFMQSQIKPHFLYNTLDTIYCLAGMGRADEAGGVTKALADYYRLVLSHGEEKITIERELAALQRYLTIMQVRYRDTLHYTIGCEEDVREVIVPKLLLQPLVENAIYHGIKPKKQPGTVEIYAARRGGAVELTVTDDGVGMTQQRFAEALAGTNHEDNSETFGMHNTVRRLQLFYGEHSRLELRTQNGKTTVAAVIYPDEARDV